MRTESREKFAFASNISERLETLVQTRYGGVWAEFLKAADIAAGSADRYKKGGGKPGFDQLVRICEVTGVAPAWLLTGEGEMKTEIGLQRELRAGVVYVPRMDVEASAGGGVEVMSEEVENFQPFRLDEIKRLTTNTTALVVISVRGDSMFPTLSPGDDLVIDMSKGQTVADGVYAVRIDDALLVKRIQHLPGKKIKVTSDNPSYGPFEVNLAGMDGEFQIVGRVVWAGRRF